MRQIGEDLQAHLAEDATTLCSAWRVTRRDGVVLGFTDHDHDLTIGGTTFLAASAFRPATGKQSPDWRRHPAMLPERCLPR